MTKAATMKTMIDSARTESMSERQRIMNLNQVIEAVKDEQPVTDEELRLAVVCLTALTNMFFMKISSAADSHFPKLVLDAEAQRKFYREALTGSMREWLGAENTPGSEEYRNLRIMSKHLFEKFTRQDAALETQPPVPTQPRPADLGPPIDR